MIWLALFLALLWACSELNFKDAECKEAPPAWWD